MRCVRVRRHGAKVQIPYIAAALVASLVAIHLLVPGGLTGKVTYLVVTVGAGWLALLGARRRSGAARRAWLWVAIGISLSAAGDLLWELVTYLRGSEPDVSIADVAWLASYVAISVGLLLLLRAGRRSARVDVDGLIDMAVVGVVALLIVWPIAIQSTVTDTSTPMLTRAIWAAYPICDVVLLALVVRTAVSRRPRAAGMSLLAAGLGCWLLSDFAYMLLPSSTAWSRWFDAGWMTGAALLAAAAWMPDGAAVVGEPVEQRGGVGAGRIALAIAPLLVPGLIELVDYNQGENPNPAAMVAATVVLAALAYMRGVRLLRATRSTEAELRSAELQFRALVRRSADTALILEADGTIRYVSPAATEQFGWDPATLIGTAGWELIHPDDRAGAFETLGAIVARAGAHARAEVRVLDLAGDWRWVEGVATNLLDEPAVHGIVANIRDISERKGAEIELSRMAHYDRLTGLPNRWLLGELLQQRLQSDCSDVALVVIDLDQFTLVNDSRGQAAGDRLLVAVAQRFREVLPPAFDVGRIGGDKFAVIIEHLEDARSAMAAAQQILVALAEPFELAEGGHVHVTASIGIALKSADDDLSSERMFQQADTAMYAAKNEGRTTAVIFDDRLRQEADNRLTIESDLRRAITADELVVLYQPVLDLLTGTMTGVEALVRWRHPTRGLLMPGEFVPIAEQSSLIDSVTQIVLDRALTDAAWWARAGHGLSVAVNLSAAQLPHDGTVEMVRRALLQSRLSPESLILEVTETALLSGAERVFTNLAAFRALGTRLALDDFGTGYSSLSYLKRVPADIVKIDQSFVEGIATNDVDRGIVIAILGLAGALGRAVVAEGVETQEQLAELRQLGCRFGQGFYWSEAVSAEEVLRLATLRSTAADVSR